MPSHFIVRSLDVGYGNTKFIVDERGGCRLFASLAPRAETAPSRSAAMQQRHTTVVFVDGQGYEVGPDSILFSEAPLLHRDYIETAQYRALVYGALDAMQVSRLDLLVTGLPVYQHHARAERLKELLTGQHEIRPGKTVEIAEVSVVAQPVGGFIAHAQESENFSQAPRRTRVWVDPGLFSLDWLVTEGLLEVPGQSSSIEGGVCEVLREVLNELNRELAESYNNIRKLDEAFRGGAPLVLRGAPVDLEPYRRVANAAASRIIQRMRNHIFSSLSEIEEVILLGGGAQYFDVALREQFPGCALYAAREPIFANVRGFQLIGQLIKRRKAA